MREEIFGPVVCIAKFRTEEEVLKLANDSIYGLAAGVQTKDYERALRITNGLKAGTTWVNMYNFIHHAIPFGGYKQSGFGRECGEAALENCKQCPHKIPSLKRRLILPFPCRYRSKGCVLQCRYSGPALVVLVTISCQKLIVAIAIKMVVRELALDALLLDWE
jgi:hypothetical protein